MSHKPDDQKHEAGLKSRGFAPSTGKGREKIYKYVRPPACIVTPRNGSPRLSFCGREIWGHDLAFRDLTEATTDDNVKSVRGEPCSACVTAAIDAATPTVEADRDRLLRAKMLDMVKVSRCIAIVDGQVIKGTK